VALLLPTMLLAGCGPASGPAGVEAPLPPKVPPVAKEQGKPEVPAMDPSLAPLATQQQVVKAVTVGRRDPFAAVLTPQVIIDPASLPQGGIKPGAGPSKPPAPLSWPKGLEFEGVLQTSSRSEAMVRYTPGEGKGGEVRLGSLNVGDVGTTQGESLLPPGWRVADINIDQGLLTLEKGGQTVMRQL